MAMSFHSYGTRNFNIHDIYIFTYKIREKERELLTLACRYNTRKDGEHAFRRGRHVPVRCLGGLARTQLRGQYRTPVREGSAGSDSLELMVGQPEALPGNLTLCAGELLMLQHGRLQWSRRKITTYFHAACPAFEITHTIQSSSPSQPSPAGSTGRFSMPLAAPNSIANLIFHAAFGRRR